MSPPAVRAREAYPQVREWLEGLPGVLWTTVSCCEGREAIYIGHGADLPEPVRNRILDRLQGIPVEFVAREVAARSG